MRHAGSAVDMTKVAENLSGAPPPQSTTGAGLGEPGAEGATGTKA